MLSLVTAADYPIIIKALPRADTYVKPVDRIGTFLITVGVPVLLVESAASCRSFCFVYTVTNHRLRVTAA